MGNNTRQVHKQSQLDEHVNLMEAQFADHFGNIDEQLFVLKETVSKIPDLKTAVDQMKMELPGVRHSLAKLHQMLQHLINSNAGESPNNRKTKESKEPESSHKEYFQTTNGNLFSKLPKLEFPKFRGEDSYGWVRKAKHFFEFNPVEERNKVNFASIHFEGQTEYWFGAYIKTKERVLWPEFVKDVHSRFAKLFKESVVGEFHKLRQQTSVEAYYNDFETIRSMMVSEGCKLEEEYFTQSFISGLKEEIKLEVEKFETSDLSRAIFLARKHEASMQQSWHTPRTSTRPSLPSSNSNYPLPKPQINTNSWKPKPVPSPTTTVYPQNQLTGPPRVNQPILNNPHTQRRMKGLCYWCDEAFTPAHNCKHKQLSMLVTDEKEPEEPPPKIIAKRPADSDIVLLCRPPPSTAVRRRGPQDRSRSLKAQAHD
ncbi:hypothetical protein RJ640_029958 [Escallonia rubra]|uniref:Ty3 transposon capsid-like protein domain-containing protein n=1 Tax=Escallonia rubra TaxID=112253 RepID=A0AA88UC90_9ASTE|nr:hypothetical protein RJ640_029958 [Escallonia rubra]